MEVSDDRIEGYALLGQPSVAVVVLLLQTPTLVRSITKLLADGPGYVQVAELFALIALNVNWLLVLAVPTLLGVPVELLQSLNRVSRSFGFVVLLIGSKSAEYFA